MTLEIIKETKPTIGKDGPEIWYWVVVDGKYLDPSKPFQKEDDADQYFNQLEAFYKAHSSLEPRAEILRTLSIDTKTQTP